MNPIDTSTLSEELQQTLRQHAGHGGPYVPDEFLDLSTLVWSWAGPSKLDFLTELRTVGIFESPADVCSSLAAMRKLRRLTLKRSGLTEFNYAEFQSVRSLSLPENTIHILRGFCASAPLSLDVTANPLSEEVYFELLPKLREAGVDVEASPEREWRVSLGFWNAGLKGHWEAGRLVLPGPGLTEDKANRIFYMSLDEAEEVLEEQDLTLDRIKELFQRRSPALKRYKPRPAPDERLAVVDADVVRRRITRSKLSKGDKSALRKFANHNGVRRFVCVSAAGLDALDGPPWGPVPEQLRAPFRICVGAFERGPIHFASDSSASPFNPFKLPAFEDADLTEVPADCFPLARGRDGAWLVHERAAEGNTGGAIALRVPGEGTHSSIAFASLGELLAAVERVEPEPPPQAIDTSDVPLAELMKPQPRATTAPLRRDDEPEVESGDATAALSWIAESAIGALDKVGLSRFVRRFPHETFVRYPESELSKLRDWNTGPAPRELRELLGAFAGIEPAPLMQLSDGDGPWFWVGPHRWPDDVSKGPAGAIPIGAVDGSEDILVWRKTGDDPVWRVAYDAPYEKGFTGEGAWFVRRYSELFGEVARIKHHHEHPVEAEAGAG